MSEFQFTRRGLLGSAVGLAAAGLAPDLLAATPTLPKSPVALNVVDVAGNLALTFIARGGVFLAGGIAAKIAPFLQQSGFRQAFIDKVPHQAMMDRMPTSVVVHPEPALAGITAYARHPELFGVVTEGRRWLK